MSNIRHALIMAAGRGTRMKPLTDDIPKPMAPYQGSTLISNGINKLRPSIDNVHITVGYKGPLLAEHVIKLKVNSVFNTEGKGNAWWIHNTLISQLDEPVLVLTADNITDLDLDWINTQYIQKNAPECMVVPVKPIEGLVGDFVHHIDSTVTHLSRTDKSNCYCSGIQVLNPKKVIKSTSNVDDFNDIWKELMAKELLTCSDIYPKYWFTVDTIDQLNELNQQSDGK